MIFTLGALSAGLLMLLFLPAFWRRAIRLASRRLEMQMPLSMTEIVAERDQLRAEFAAERRKQEQKSERLAGELARDRAELGVRATNLVLVREELAAASAEGVRIQEEADRLERQLNEVVTERAVVEKEHYDTLGILERRTNTLNLLRTEHERLSRTSDEQRTTIAGLETKISGLELDLDSERQSSEALSKALSEKVSLSEFLERERDQFRSDAASAHTRREKLAESLAAQQQRVEELEADLRNQRRDRAKLADDIDHFKNQLEKAASSEASLRQNAREQSEKLESMRLSVADRIEEERSSQSVLQGQLDTSRREIQTLRGELAKLRGAGEAVRMADLASITRNGRDREGNMSELRQAIAELGSDIIRVSEQAKSTQNAGAPDTLPDTFDLSSKIDEIHEKVKASAGAE